MYIITHSNFYINILVSNREIFKRKAFHILSLSKYGLINAACRAASFLQPSSPLDLKVMYVYAVDEIVTCNTECTYISTKASGVPCISPLTVSSLVFIHHPLTPSLFACLSVN